MKDNSKIASDTLASLFPLNMMTPVEREMLSEQLTLLKGKSGKELVEAGVSDNKALFVLSGRVKRVAQDGDSKIIEDGAPELKGPISFAIPHRYTVTCLNTVEYFRVDSHIIANLLERKHAKAKQASDSDDPESRENPLFAAIARDLADDKLVIPALPKVAMAVRKAIENDENVRNVEMLIQADPALAALLLKTANSALYRTRNSVASIEQAIMRMGLRTVKSLVTSYSVKHLFNTQNKALKRRMKQLWMHSTEVAAVSYVLAKHLRDFDPEQALLMGLLHNVGVLPILSYAERYPDIASDEDALDATIARLGTKVGVIIISNWQFSEEFISIVRESGDWLREGDQQADYTDLILVAIRHTYIGREHHDKDLPQLYEIPAFQKLGLDQYDPERGLSIIADANQQISELRSLLVM